nr:succinylglutamate desuccinylase/aspartoacylase family protein [Halomarina sp. BCD28]
MKRFGDGEEDGPTLFCSATIHGDELNGVKVCQEVATAYSPADVRGTLVVPHVLTVPGFLAQQRYLPIDDQDPNRAFPGREGSATAGRMAARIYETFVSQCDYGLDFYTSTRGRTTMYHLRTDLSNPEVERLARAFGANVILSGTEDPGSLRGTATAAGIPVLTVEMGKAHRFQPCSSGRPSTASPDYVWLPAERTLGNVESVLAQLGMLPGRPVQWPGWWQVVQGDGEKAWLRRTRAVSSI